MDYEGCKIELYCRFRIIKKGKKQNRYRHIDEYTIIMGH